jgi:hypothetical protein
MRAGPVGTMHGTRDIPSRTSSISQITALRIFQPWRIPTLSSGTIAEQGIDSFGQVQPGRHGGLSHAATYELRYAHVPRDYEARPLNCDPFDDSPTAS